MPGRPVLLALLIVLATAHGIAAHAALPSSPEAYLRQADGVRRSQDRPWVPEAGQLGNLRHLHIVASDCAVRLVSGNENRVFPGTREVFVIERSRVLDADPDEQPPPHDVLLATSLDHACQGTGSCGVSITRATRAARVAAGGDACFTVQIATAHDMLVGGDRLTLLADRLRQPSLRIIVNPSAQLQLLLEDVDLGALSIKANAPVRVGGSGRVDFLQASSSNGGSVMLFHTIDARHVGVSSTTTGTQWSIRIGADTEASYYQPARAPGPLAEGYPIEIDGPLDRLQIPASRVDPRPLREATRAAARTLRNDVLARAGPAPVLPASDPALMSLASAVASLPADPRERVARVLARYLPAAVRITHVELWKRGGRLEGTAPDAATMAQVAPRLDASGELINVSGGGGSAERDGTYSFKMQMIFSCDTPGEPSMCPAGDPRRPGRYSEMQVIETLERVLAPTATLHDARLDGTRIHMEADAPDEAAARAALARVQQNGGLFRVSAHGVGQRGNTWRITGHLELVCAVPPKPDGICELQQPIDPALLDGPE